MCILLSSRVGRELGRGGGGGGEADSPASKGMRVEVMKSGSASVHHSMDTNASSAAQFCS